MNDEERIAKTAASVKDSQQVVAMTCALEMEVCMRIPRPRNYLELIGSSYFKDVGAREATCARFYSTIAQTLFVKHNEIERLIEQFALHYFKDPRNRFQYLLFLSIWFEMRPKHFLKYIYYFLYIVVENQQLNDGGLLAKHLLAILSAAEWNLMFQYLPLDAVGSSLKLIYESLDGHDVFIAGSSSKAVSNRFYIDNLENGINMSSNTKRLELWFELLQRCISLELFASESDDKLVIPFGEELAQVENDTKRVKWNPHEDEESGSLADRLTRLGDIDNLAAKFARHRHLRVLFDDERYAEIWCRVVMHITTSPSETEKFEFIKTTVDRARPIPNELKAYTLPWCHWGVVNNEERSSKEQEVLLAIDRYKTAIAEMHLEEEIRLRAFARLEAQELIYEKFKELCQFVKRKEADKIWNAYSSWHDSLGDVTYTDSAAKSVRVLLTGLNYTFYEPTILAAKKKTKKDPVASKRAKPKK